MKINNQYNPFKYFFIALFVTWISLFATVYCSHTEGLESCQILIMLPVLFTPFFIAIFMIYGSKNDELKKISKEV